MKMNFSESVKTILNSSFSRRLTSLTNLYNDMNPNIGSDTRSGSSYIRELHTGSNTRQLELMRWMYSTGKCYVDPDNGDLVYAFRIGSNSEFKKFIDLHNEVSNVINELPALYIEPGIDTDGLLSDPRVKLISGVILGSRRSAKGLFKNCINLHSVQYIVNAEGLSDVSEMFYGCTKLVDAPRFINSNKNEFVTVVKNPRSNKYIRLNDDYLNDQSLFDTLNVDELKTVEVSVGKLSTNKLHITNATSMFENCSSLRSIDELINLSKFSFENVEYGSKLFANCMDLYEVNLGKMDRLIDASYMFTNCSYLHKVRFDSVKSIRSAIGMFMGCSALNYLSFKSKSNKNFSLELFAKKSDAQVMNEHTKKNKDKNKNKSGDVNLPNLMYAKDMFNGCTNLANVPNLDTKRVIDMTNMFRDCSSLSSIPKLNYSAVINMTSTFEGCTNIDNVKIENAYRLEILNSAFDGCINLHMAEFIKVGRLKSVANIFRSCRSLYKITGLDFSNVLMADGAFKGCLSLKYLPSEVLKVSTSSKLGLKDLDSYIITNSDKHGGKK